MSEVNSQLSQALVIYIGYGIEAYPKEDADRLVLHFSPETAMPFIGEIQGILTDLNQLRPDWSRLSLQEASSWAKEVMAARHAQLDDDALNALGWIFTWWWR